MSFGRGMAYCVVWPIFMALLSISGFAVQKTLAQRSVECRGNEDGPFRCDKRTASASDKVVQFCNKLPVLEAEFCLANNPFFPFATVTRLKLSVTAEELSNLTDVLTLDSEKLKSKLKELHVYQTDDTDLPSEPFKSLTTTSDKKLEKLYISGGYLTDFKWLNDFRDLSLKVLNISHSRNFTWTDLPRSSLSLNSLETLVLSDNGFSRLPSQLISAAKSSLKHLDLSSNNLLGLPNEIYELARLENLSLANNKLSWISGPKSNQFASLKNLILEGNPWRCNCSSWSLKDFTERRTVNVIGGKCASGPLKGRPVVKVTKQEFCQYDVTIVDRQTTVHNKMKGPALVRYENIFRPVCRVDRNRPRTARDTLSDLLCLQYGLEPIVKTVLIEGFASYPYAHLYDSNVIKLDYECIGNETRVEECPVHLETKCTISAVVCELMPRKSETKQIARGSLEVQGTATAGHVNVSWPKRNTSDWSGLAYGYIVLAERVSNVTDIRRVQVDRAKTSYLLTGLSKGATYNIGVQSITIDSDGNPSKNLTMTEYVNVTVASAKPRTPQLVSLSGSRAPKGSKKSYQLIVKWKQLTGSDWQGLPGKYVVLITWLGNGSQSSQENCTASAGASSCPIPHDHVHQQFRVSLRACNLEECSEPADAVQWTDPVEAPVISNISLRRNHLLISWNNYSSVFDSEMYYQLLACDGNQTCTVKKKVLARNDHLVNFSLADGVPREIALEACSKQGNCGERAWREWNCLSMQALPERELAYENRRWVYKLLLKNMTLSTTNIPVAVRLSKDNNMVNPSLTTYYVSRKNGEIEVTTEQLNGLDWNSTYAVSWHVLGRPSNRTCRSTQFDMPLNDFEGLEIEESMLNHSIQGTNVNIELPAKDKYWYHVLAMAANKPDITSLQRGQMNSGKVTLRGLSAETKYNIQVQRCFRHDAIRTKDWCGQWTPLDTTFNTSTAAPTTSPHRPTSTSSTNNDVYLYLLCALCAIAIVVIICFVVMRSRELRHRKNSVVSLTATMGRKPSVSSSVRKQTAHRDSVVMLANFRKDELRLEQVLGSGEFGSVHKAWYAEHKGSRQVVAVKMLKESAGIEERQSLLEEINLMASLGQHQNIIRLVAGGNYLGRFPCMVMEFMDGGDLLTFLRRNRLNQDPDIKYENVLCTRLTSRHLLSIAWQVAKGMDYLSRISVVHRDLAARNMLIQEDGEHLLVKIADFGLARNVYVQRIYTRRRGTRVPLKWLALESLLNDVYTSESDVWSFGILLWEIVTLGGNPYPGIPAHKICHFLRMNYRMPRPEYCSNELYGIMRRCWDGDASKRPTFAELVVTFDEMLDHAKDHPYIKVEPTTNALRHDVVDEDSDSDFEPIRFGMVRNTVYSDGYLRPMTEMPPELRDENGLLDIPNAPQEMTSDSSQASPTREGAPPQRRSFRLSWQPSRQQSWQTSRQDSRSERRKLKKLPSFTNMFSAASRSLQATFLGSSESLNHGAKGLKRSVKEKRRRSSEGASEPHLHAVQLQRQELSEDGNSSPRYKTTPVHSVKSQEHMEVNQKDVFQQSHGSSVPADIVYLEATPTIKDQADDVQRSLGTSAPVNVEHVQFYPTIRDGHIERNESTGV